jgi:uncharacterized protein
VVVSNTSPIINLACIGQLDLLPALYGQIAIPDAVFHEIAVIDPDAPGAAEIRRAPWVQTGIVANRPLVAALSLELDPGEAEAIACAVEHEASLLLIDERRGRRVAQRFDVPVMGLLGVLLLAKQRGIIEHIRPLLDALRKTAGFWISGALYARALKEAGEG